ncbi:MAG: hypothetical protein DRQ40_02675 [Gammaproteobacteria bacterium]|nr:MAG: hypothetical protein DRQ40_02675 [Gammaproteobacteria bacterium]
MKSKNRLNNTAEFFTPTSLVNHAIDKIEKYAPDSFTNPDKTSLDPTCGNGQFIMGVLNRKVRNGIPVERALSTTFGADLMIDNICDVIARIYFWLHHDIDIFDDTGYPIGDLTYPKNEDEHSVYWLYENKDEFFDHPEKYDGRFDLEKRDTLFKRVYKYNGDKLTVRQHPKRWWEFGFMTANYAETTKHNGMIYGWTKNFQVADVLTYDNHFDGNHRTLLNYVRIAEEQKIKDDIEQAKRQQAYNHSLFG